MDDILLRILNARSRRLNQLRSHPIAVFGNDHIGAKIFLQGIYERQEIEDLFAILRALNLDPSEMTIADVGANIGNHSIQFSKAFKMVLAFEPNPRVFAVLKANSSMIDRIKTYQIGVGRGEAKARISEHWNNLGESSIVHHNQADDSFNIDIQPLDTLSKKFGKIDVIKIDVEGMEMDVLLGSKNLIKKHHPIICLEQHSSEFTNERTETEAVDWLRERGYRMMALDEYRLRRWVNRRLISAWRYLISGKRTIIEYPKLRRAKYHLIYAIHESMF